MVLPCVPATASTQRSRSTFSYSHCGPEMYGRPASRIASISGLPRDTTLPIDEHVGVARDAAQLRGVEAFGELDAERRELRAHRRIDVGVAAGDAMAGAPCAIAAMPPMKVPQMPRMWRCMLVE